MLADWLSSVYTGRIKITNIHYEIEDWLCTNLLFLVIKRQRVKLENICWCFLNKTQNSFTLGWEKIWKSLADAVYYNIYIEKYPIPKWKCYMGLPCPFHHSWLWFCDKCQKQLSKHCSNYPEWWSFGREMEPFLRSPANDWWQILKANVSGTQCYK